MGVGSGALAAGPCAIWVCCALCKSGELSGDDCISAQARQNRLQAARRSVFVAQAKRNAVRATSAHETVKSTLFF